MALDLEAVSKGFSDGTKKARPSSSMRIHDNSLKDFDKFCLEKYQESATLIYPKLANYEIKASLGIIQEWINWSLEKKNKPASIKVKLCYIISKLAEEGLELSKTDKKKLYIPKSEKPILHALSVEELKMIIGVAPSLKKAMYLCQSSSAMRIGELLQLKKSDLDKGKSRIQVNIRAGITKTKQARITFFSKEAEKYLKPYLNIDEDDLIFTNNPNSWHAEISECTCFKRYCNKVNLTKCYPGTRNRLISTHSLRSFAITRLNKVDEFGFGHSLAGHEYYMKQYDRYNEEELLELYIKAEPELWIYQSKPESKDMVALQKQINDLRDELSDVQDQYVRDTTPYGQDPKTVEWKHANFYSKEENERNARKQMNEQK